MRLLIYILSIMAFLNRGYSQVLVSQDFFQGEVIGFGFSPWQNNVTDTLYYNLQPNSVLRKVLLFYTSYDTPADETILINNNPVLLSLDYKLPYSGFEALHGSGLIFNIQTMLSDITGIVPTTDTSIIITTQYTYNLNGAFSHFYFLIFADNNTLPKINSTVIVNDLDSDSLLTYNFNNFNTMDTNVPIGLSVNCSGQCVVINDGSYLYVNNDSIGLIKGNDYNTPVSCNGTRGDFHYHSNTLIALGDDTANNYMNGVDALADIKNYITDTDSLQLRIEYEGKDNPFNQYSIYTNPFFQFYLTYSTPCDTFSVSVPSEVSVCKGDTAQINITGGASYEWEPQVNLSCYNCANPTYTGDSTVYYAVRIWNNDSCSKVLPVHIRVHDNPLPAQLSISGSACVPNNTGHVAVTLNWQTSDYSLNGGTSQSNGHFYNLAAGAYTFTTIDPTTGCTVDTNIVVPSIIDVQASFDASSISGEFPLVVDFNSTSSSNSYQYWYIDQDTVFPPSFTHTFEQAGAFPVTLVAYDTYIRCSDTADVVISVGSPFKIIAPSTIKDKEQTYQISTFGVMNMKYTLYNAIGQKIYEENFSNLSDGVQNLWNPLHYQRGAYLYRIIALGEKGDYKEFKGKVLNLW